MVVPIYKKKPSLGTTHHHLQPQQNYQETEYLYTTDSRVQEKNFDTLILTKDNKVT